MDVLKRGLVWVLMLLMLNVYFPGSVFAQEKPMPAEEKITMHPLEVRSTPKEEMEVEEVKKKSKWWLWGLLGAALIGGAAAVNSDSPSPDKDDDTGGITGRW